MYSRGGSTDWALLWPPLDSGEFIPIEIAPRPPETAGGPEKVISDGLSPVTQPQPIPTDAETQGGRVVAGSRPPATRLTPLWDGALRVTW